MDTQRDYEPFRNLLDQLCATWDRPPAKEALVQSYWNALKEVRYAEVKANVERIIRTATRESKWPHPGDLRNELPSTVAPAREAEFHKSEERNIRVWEEQIRQDPELARIELGLARWARILAVDHESTPQYAEAIRASRRLSDARRKLWEQRAKNLGEPL